MVILVTARMGNTLVVLQGKGKRKSLPIFAAGTKLSRLAPTAKSRAAQPYHHISVCKVFQWEYLIYGPCWMASSGFRICMPVRGVTDKKSPR